MAEGKEESYSVIYLSEKDDESIQFFDSNRDRTVLCEFTMKNKRNIVIEANVIIFFFLKSIGCLPISEDANYNINFSWKSGVTMRTITIILASFLLAIVNSFHFLTNSEGVLWDDRIILYMCIVYTFLPVLGLCITSDMNKIVIYFRLWSNYQTNYQSITGRTLNFNNKKQQLISLIASEILIAMLGLYGLHLVSEIAEKAGWKFDMRYKPVLLISATYSCSLLVGLWILWWFLMKTLRNASQELQTAFKESDGSPHTIARFRRLWRDLQELTVGLSSAFSNTLFFFMLSGYLPSMATWYLVVCLKLGDSTTNLFLALSTTVFIVLIPECCHLTIKKVGEEFRNELRIMKRRTLREEGIKELELFESNINAFPPKFPIAGCFSLDRKTNVSVYLNLAQALVIIYQMNS